MLYRIVLPEKGGFNIEAGSIEEAHAKACKMIREHPEMVIHGVYPPWHRPLWKQLILG